MADEEGKPESEKKPEVNVDEKIKNAIEEVQKQFKTEISGLNRRNSELEKELESERKAKMTETERLKFEKEAAEKKAAALEAKQQEYQTEQMITAGLAAKDISVSVRSLMRRPSTAEELLEWVKQYTQSVESEVERRVTERLAGKPPAAGGQQKPATKLESFADGKNATEAEFVAYLKKAIGE